jgi:hypothetical protein
MTLQKRQQFLILNLIKVQNKQQQKVKEKGNKQEREQQKEENNNKSDVILFDINNPLMNSNIENIRYLLVYIFYNI